jgi:hypothetical protein
VKNLRRIKFTTTLKGDDDALGALADRISGVIADRMQAALAEVREAQWTSNLAFREDGLEYRAMGIFSRKTPAIVPYCRFTLITFAS